MTLTPHTARLLLFMLGHGGSRIRPNGDYPASETMEMERKLKEVAGVYDPWIAAGEDALAGLEEEIRVKGRCDGDPAFRPSRQGVAQ